MCNLRKASLSNNGNFNFSGICHFFFYTSSDTLGQYIRFLICSHIRNNNQLNFRQVSPTCDEELIKKQKIKEKISPKKISLYLAIKKAASISKKHHNSLIIGSDTTIDLNNKMVEKAKNIKEAKKKHSSLYNKLGSCV